MEAPQVTLSAVRRTAALSWNCILLLLHLFLTRSEDRRWGCSEFTCPYRHEAVFTFLSNYIKLCLYFVTTDKEVKLILLLFSFICSLLFSSFHVTCENKFSAAYLLYFTCSFPL